MSNNFKFGLVVAIAIAAIVIGIIAVASIQDTSNDTSQVEDGQCWSEAGGVGNLLKNSATREQCEELGGKSICNVGGSCDDL